MSIRKKFVGNIHNTNTVFEAFYSKIGKVFVFWGKGPQNTKHKYRLQYSRKYYALEYRISLKYPHTDRPPRKAMGGTNKAC